MSCTKPIATKQQSVHGLVSQPITADVGHLTWQFSVATLALASGTRDSQPYNTWHQNNDKT